VSIPCPGEQCLILAKVPLYAGVSVNCWEKWIFQQLGRQKTGGLGSRPAHAKS
jgi:hypothetical protein